MFFKKKRKSFYTCDDIKEMLIAYHEKGDRRIKELNQNLKYFAHRHDYHKLDVIQEYDIVSKDLKNNKIVFQDSSEGLDKVFIYTEYYYFDKSDIVVEYNGRICLYEAEVYRFGYETENGNTFLYFGYRNAYEDSCWGAGTCDESSRLSRQSYDEFCEVRHGLKYLQTGQLLEIPLYSEKVLLIKKYMNFDLLTFNSCLLKDFKRHNEYLETKYNSISITIELSLNEKKVQKNIITIEEILKNEIYLLWLRNQVKAIHRLYKDWYNEDEHGKFIDDLDEYADQYYLESLYIDNQGNISAYYMDKVDSFFGHGVSIDIGSRGKIHKFSI